jgi:N-acylneuraminate cytidylyltransferase/CMP-N,N'-diacetyllegionaminic acid synthase
MGTHHMLEGKKILCLITARGGSKGLPGKNIRNLCGKPLIAWTIDTALASKLFDDVVVSTDSEGIAAVARKYGAEVPFLRPPELASDTATSMDAIIHALDNLAAQGREYDVLVLLEPTSPLRDVGDINTAVARLLASDASAIVGVCCAESNHPSFMYRLDANGCLQPYLDRQPSSVRRQDIEPLYFLEGSIYASRIDVLRERRTFYHSDTLAYEVPKWKAIEIDDIEDFMMVEAIVRHRGLDKQRN